MSSLNETYWRSLREYRSAGGMPATEEDGLSRRRWLQLMGASLALAGAAAAAGKRPSCCPWKAATRLGPGKVERFATAMDLGGSALGLLVTCVDGRPIKVEGNPKHPE